MSIPDRQFTDAECERALRQEPLFGTTGRTWPPPAAVDRLAVAFFEGEINWILHMPDEKREFSKLDQNNRDRLLKEAAWCLGRLAIVGYHVVYKR